MLFPAINPFMTLKYATRTHTKKNLNLPTQVSISQSEIIESEDVPGDGDGVSEGSENEVEELAPCLIFFNLWVRMICFDI